MLEGVIIRSEQEADRVIALYSDTVRKVCMLHLKSYADTEDILQTVSLEYIPYPGSFKSSEHEKAWIIRVTINAYKDYLKSLFRSHAVPLGEITGMAGEIPKEHNEVLEMALPLPKRHKDVVYLFYYEDYMAVEVSEILDRNVDTAYTLLARVKVMLKEVLGGDDLE